MTSLSTSLITSMEYEMQLEGGLYRMLHRVRVACSVIPAGWLHHFQARINKNLTTESLAAAR